MGKNKITGIEKIKERSKLNVTFQKRKRGLLKKVIELTSLCDQQTLMFIYDDHKNTLIQYQSSPDFNIQSVGKLISSSDGM